MTTPRDLNREFRAYCDRQAVGRAPDGLLAASMAEIESTRQRPGLLVADRWRPRRLSSHGNLGPRIVVAAVVVLLLIALTTALLLIGSSRRLPPPFGPAKPGLLAFDAGGDVYASKLDGSPPIRIISGPGPDSQAVYSPDGSRIAFETVQPDLSRTLLVMAADGGPATPLIEDLGFAPGGIAWSPDSRQVAIANLPAGSPESRDRILLARIGRSGVTTLGGPDVFGVDPAWSPDGTHIAFTRYFECCSDEPDAVWLVDVDGSDLHPLSSHSLTSPIQSSWSTGGGRAAWSPDGTRVAFLAAPSGGLKQVFVSGVEGGEPLDVSNSPQDVLGFSWSPDGTRIAYTRMRGQYGVESVIVVADADGTHAVTLNGPPLSGETPIWSPDGKRVLGLAWSSPEVVGGLMTGKDEIVAFDPSNRVPPTVIPLPRFNNASWQRLAP